MNKKFNRLERQVFFKTNKLDKRARDKLKRSYIYLRHGTDLKEQVRRYGSLAKLTQHQVKNKTDKWYFILPVYYLKKGGTGYRFLDEIIPFNIQDPEMYIKRVLWNEDRFVFVLGKKKNVNVRFFTKEEIKQLEINKLLKGETK